MALRPDAGHGLLIHEVSRSHTMKHHIRYDSSRRVISSSPRPLSGNTQHSQQTNIHASGGILTDGLSMRPAADLCLRPRVHWERILKSIQHVNCTLCPDVQNFVSNSVKLCCKFHINPYIISLISYLPKYRLFLEFPTAA